MAISPIINVRVDRVTACILTNIAKERGMTKSELVRDILYAALDDQYSGYKPHIEEVAGQVEIDELK